jgi:hypothetical protein
MQSDEVIRLLLMFFILPLWLIAGFADYLCHRASHIELTSGWRESILHILQFAEMAVPVIAALFLEINTGIMLLMICCFLLHEATAIMDVRYASATRYVSPIEQHIHSFLEMLPLMALLLVVALYWERFIPLFGFGTADFTIRLKDSTLPITYIATMLCLTLLLEILPYGEELLRGLRQRRTVLTRRFP